jgi:large subunit ribosomal protein L27
MFKNICKNTSGLVFYSQNMPIFTFATKMRAGVTKNKKDSAGRRLGLKKYGGEEVTENQILIRQRGFRWKPGENVHFGKDHTLHASKEGKVFFTQDPWSRKRKVSVHVVEQEVPNRKVYY